MRAAASDTHANRLVHAWLPRAPDVQLRRGSGKTARHIHTCRPYYGLNISAIPGAFLDMDEDDSVASDRQEYDDGARHLWKSSIRQVLASRGQWELIQSLNQN